MEMLPLAPTLESSPGLCSFAGSDIGLKLTDLNSAVVQPGSSWLLVLLHLDGDMVGTGGAQGQLRGLSHTLHTAILLSCHNLLEAHRLGFAGRQFLGRETGLGSSRRDGGETLGTTEQAKGLGTTRSVFLHVLWELGRSQGFSGLLFQAVLPPSGLC